MGDEVGMVPPSTPQDDGGCESTGEQDGGCGFSDPRRRCDAALAVVKIKPTTKPAAAPKISPSAICSTIVPETSRRLAPTPAPTGPPQPSGLA
jgi:hypothetical protein